MDVTFHEIKSFFVNPKLQGEKTLEAMELSFSSLSYLSLPDAQDPSDDVTINGIEPTYNEEEDKFFGKKYNKRQPTLIAE